jgi:S1 RNA binding domain protein
MSVEIGKIYEGKVTGITKFGAFVQLPGGKSGMVHISEVAPVYVDDIAQHLTEGQAVQVKVIGVDPQNRVNLSIKRVAEGEGIPPPRPPRAASSGAARPASGPRPERPERPRAPRPPARAALPDDSFEGKLKAFMQSSESRMSDIRSQREGRSSGGKRRK